ncbi:hypothetical protein ACKWTF_005487 [Chironomus riparius]
MFAAYRKDADDAKDAETSEFIPHTSFQDNSKALVKVISSDSSESANDSDDNQPKAIQYYKTKPQSTKVELYYLDKDQRIEYLKLESLPKRVLPLYRIMRRFAYYGKQRKFRRYFKKKEKTSKKSLDEPENDEGQQMKIYLNQNQNDIEKWIEYINYKHIISTTQNDKSEKSKLETIEKALHFNTCSQKLTELYLRTIPNVHTSDVVIDLIQDLIAKEPYNVIYWKHLLNTFTSSMGCDVENGLKEYGKALRIIQKSHDSDLLMLQIFKMCCLLLRQAGLNEQFFAVIHLMTSMNINESSDLDRVFYTNEIQNPHLLEYEDLVLSSELPMNELWYRMETIRAICNFLPVKVTSNINQEQMQDPQRYVFNEDICNLVVPLKNSKAYNFDLFIIVLKMFKFPLPYYEIKNELFRTDENEMEDGMNFLSVLLRHTFSSENFNRIFFSIIKDLNISPNYLSFNVEYEPFLNCILKILENCSSSFNDKQNKLVLILWLRLQRLIVIIDQLKLKVERKEQDPVEYTKYKKQIKSKVKNILKTSKYQNDLNIYTEYALIEATLGDNDSCDKILKMAISAAIDSHQHDPQSELSFYQISLHYCERKLLQNNKDECLAQLRLLTGHCDNPISYFESKIQEIRDDDNSNEIEDYFLPITNKFNLIKAKAYYQLLTQSKKSTLIAVLGHIDAVKEKSLLKEKLYELYVEIFHIKVNEELPNMRSYMEVLSRALLDYPKNIFIMHTIASQYSLRWFDIRKLLLKNPTNESIFYLLIASKYREEQFVGDDAKIYQHRIYNAIDGLMSRKVQGISSVLTWRLYLRAAFNYDFTKCKTILYQLLDSYPMNKQLYLDGARYLPEEHSQLHDLIIEKGLRTHAIAEELEILRTSSHHAG